MSTESTTALRAKPCRDVLRLQKRATHNAVQGSEFFAFRLSSWFVFVRERLDSEPRVGEQLSLF
ncbi:hypothetical protein ACW5WQ_21220 [Aeromonas rivuli]|jgi:hypothetical protein|uniref:hypothetical protein n=1 Tax=Aeromonas rivuli TaxID=648794 RepID=UPI0005A73162|nr:hypothetical protein [Aeromonas rivuli]